MYDRKRRRKEKRLTEAVLAARTRRSGSPAAALEKKRKKKKKEGGEGGEEGEGATRTRSATPSRRLLRSNYNVVLAVVSLERKKEKRKGEEKGKESSGDAPWPQVRPSPRGSARLAHPRRLSQSSGGKEKGKKGRGREDRVGEAEDFRATLLHCSFSSSLFMKKKEKGGKGEREVRVRASSEVVQIVPRASCVRQCIFLSQVEKKKKKKKKKKKRREKNERAGLPTRNVFF